MSIYQLVQTLLDFSKQFTDSSLQRMSICSDSSQLLKLVYRFSRHGRQSVACSDPNSEMFRNMDALLILVHSPLTYSSTCPDGIFKPISDKILSHLQMASLSPFPQLCFDEHKFMGTLVSNHLLPSSHERQNSPF